MSRLRGWIACPLAAENVRAMFPEMEWVSLKPTFPLFPIRDNTGLVAVIGYFEPTTEPWEESFLRVGGPFQPPRERRTVRVVQDAVPS